jgi:hypothetical protein
MLGSLQILLESPDGGAGDAVGAAELCGFEAVSVAPMGSDIDVTRWPSGGLITTAGANADAPTSNVPFIFSGT